MKCTLLAECMYHICLKYLDNRDYVNSVNLDQTALKAWPDQSNHTIRGMGTSTFFSHHPLPRVIISVISCLLFG